jgi:hypothetical protein
MRQRRTTTRIAIVAAVPAALAIAALAASSGGAQTPGSRTISVVEHNEIVHVNDVAPKIGKRGFSAGDGVAFNARLTHGAGKRVGAVRGGAVLTPGTPSLAVLTGVYTLADGELHFIAQANPAANTRVTGSIVGGTGAYAGARGTVLSVKRTEKGKEVFDDTLTLLP